MSTIKVDLEVSQFISEMQKVMSLEVQQIKLLRETAKVVILWDDATDKMVKTLKGQISATESVNASWRKLSNDGGEQFVAKVTQITNEAAKATRAQKELADGAKALNAILKQSEKDAAQAIKDAEKAKREAIAETTRLRRIDEAEMRRANARGLAEAKERGRQMAEANQVIGPRGVKTTTVSDAQIRAESQAARREFQRNNTNSITDRVNRFTSGEQQRLAGLGLSLDTGKLNTIAMKIGELGSKANLSAKQVGDLFAKIAAGDFKGIEGRLSSLVAQILRYQTTMNAERSRAIGKPPEIPTISQNHIDAIKSYYNWLNRIGATASNLALYRTFNAVTQALTDSVGHARELQINISLIRTISQEAQLTTTQWAKGLKDVSNTTGIDVNKMAKAGYDAVSNQVTKGQATFDFLKSAGELARTTGSEVGQAGNALASVINSYKRDAKDADDISAKLFKTIDLGHINMAELSQGMGMVNNTAHQLGVSFEEVDAYLATLTRNGLTTSEAMTSLNAVMNEITNPTERMKALLKELGYESGRSAVAIERGLTPVLTKTTNAIKAQGLEITDYFNSVRSGRGIATFLGNPQEILRDLDQIKNKSAETFKAAKEIRGESDADKLAKGLETLKNALSTSFGDVLVRLISQFVDLMAKTEDIEKSASRMFRVFATGGITIGVLVTSLRAAAIATEFMAIRKMRLAAATASSTAATVADTAATNANTLAKARTGAGSLAGFAAANPLIGLGVLAVTGVSAYAAYKATAVDAFDKTGQAYQELVAKYKAEDAAKALEKSVEPITKLKEQLQEAAALAGGKLASAFAENEKALKNIRDRIRESNNNLKSGFVGALDLSRNKLKEMETDLGRINDRLRDGGKRKDMFNEAARQATTGTMTKYATPQQNLRIVESEISRVQEKIQELLKKGTVESLGEADQLYDKLLQLTTQLYEQEAEIQKAAFEKNLELRAAAGERIEGVQTFVYDPLRQQQAINQLLAERNKAERVGNGLLMEQKRIKEDAIAKEKTRLSALEKSIQKFENFGIYNDQGQIKPEYLTPTGKLDKGRVDADFKSTADDLRKNLPGDITGRLNLDKEIKARAALNDEEVKRVLSQDKLAVAQKELKRNTDDTTSALDKGRKSVIEYDTATKTLVQELKVLTESLGKAASTAPEVFLKADTMPGPAGYLQRAFREAVDPLKEGTALEGSRNVFGPLVAEANAIIEEARKITEGERKTKVAGVEVSDPEAVKALRDRVRALRGSMLKGVEDTSKFAYGKSVDAASFPVENENLGIFDQRLKKTEEALEKALQNFDKGKVEVDQAKPKIMDLDAALRSSVKSYDDLGKGVSGVIGGIAFSADQATARIDKLIESTQEAARRIAELNGPEFVGPPAPQAKAFGGPIYRNYGGPIGNDRQMAWLQDGEYVMNQAATRRFYSTIVSQNNAGRVPQYFNSGGPVTNMGGVNINVNESKNPGGTSRDIFRAINRAKRLGMG